MVVEVALGILLALAILFIGLPVAIWLIGVVLNTVAGNFQRAVSYTTGRSGQDAATETGACPSINAGLGGTNSPSSDSCVASVAFLQRCG